MADKKTLELQIQVLMQQAQQQIKTFASDIKSAATQIKNLNVNSADVKKSIESVQTEAKRAATELKTFATDGSSSISKLTKEIGTLAAVTAAVSFDKWVAGLAGSALSASTSFRAAKEDFGIMLGDMEAGAGLFAELQEFNFWTPFDLEQTSQAAKVLMAAKVPLKDMTEYLTRFGDISQGNGQRFQSFINAFSKASAKGKADMEVLNVYIDQGVQILDALGEQLGVTSAEIVDMASKGKVSFQDLDNALASLAAEGGLYYNSMATASQRLDAMQAGLEESVNALAASFGDMLAPMAAKVLEVFTNLIDTINNSPFLKGVLAAALIAIAVAINTHMIKALLAFAAKTWGAYAAQMAFNTALAAAKPWLIAGTVAVAAATAGYVAYAAAQQKATEATNEHALAKKQLDQAFKDSMANASATDAQLAIENYSRQIAMQKTILEQYKKQLANTPAETWQSSASGYSTVKVANPEYKKIQDNIAATEQKLKDFESRVDEARKRVQGLQVETVNAELERANEILAHRDQLYKSTTEYQREQVAQELEFAKSLRTIQTMNKDGTYSGFDKAKTEAIIRDLEEQMEKLTPKLGNEWQVKMLEGKDKVMHEWNQAIETLNQKGKNVFGEGFVNEPAFKAEMDALNQYFQEQIDKMKENEKISISFGQSVSQAATDATSGSDLGIIVSGIQNGESIWAILVKIILSVVQELESFQKAINIISSALRIIFERLEPLLDDMTTYIDELIGNLVEVLGPLLAIIIAITNSSLKPILQIINTILEVLKPLIELFVMLYNVIATVINFFGDFVGIHLDIINFSTEVQRATDELDKHTTMMQKKYERQAQAVEDLLQSQLNSLRSQYELGLISREEYESQAEKYAAAADSKIYDINKKMEEHLKAIEENTAAVLDEEQKEKIEKEVRNNSKPASDPTSDPMYWIMGALTGGISLIGGLNSYNSGSPSIEHDQLAMVHQGEIIVPRTFADGIRSGDLSLSSKNSSSNTPPVYVTVNVAGSVTTEAELTTAIYNGIANGIQTRKYQPLPGA